MLASHRRGLALGSLLLLVPWSVAAAQGSAPATAAAPQAAPDASQGPPLSGPSILRSLALGIDMSPLGRLGGEGSPGAESPVAFTNAIRKAAGLAGRNDDAALAALRTTFTVDGAAIYRLSCRSCHGPGGAGKPPAIGSLIGPSLALSSAHHEEVMRAAGAKVRPELAQQLAAQADQTLRQRLAEGGQKPKLPYLETMPAFAYLSQPEIAALEGYLKRLAKVPGVEPKLPLATESALRIGEHVVRGTCRVCHDATGAGAGHSLMMAGLVPALVGMPEQLSLEAVVHKVRHGWNALPGLSHELSRMPVYPYLSDEEVVAAYLYLAFRPPQAK